MMKYVFKLYCNLPHISFDVFNFIQLLIEITKNAENYNFEGILFHFNQLMPDPFIMAAFVIQNTKKLSPIIAVQPNYCLPLSTAKMIQSISSLYDRKIILNMITGAAKSELEHMNEKLDHDERYVRLSEFIKVLKSLLSSNGAVTFNGDYYNYTDIQLTPGISPHLFPDFFVAGSSSSSKNVVMEHADVFITHPEPPEQFQQSFATQLNNPDLRAGIKIGIIARETTEEAWAAAQEKYPQNSRGAIITKLKKKSESNWLRQLATLGSEAEVIDDVYWMGGFNSGKANNPILVGNYEEVSEYMMRYLDLGVSDIIVAGLETESDFRHSDQVFQKIRSVT
jgi:alkanesulfonate monooxygenase